MTRAYQELRSLREDRARLESARVALQETLASLSMQASWAASLRAAAQTSRSRQDAVIAPGSFVLEKAPFQQTDELVRQARLAVTQVQRRLARKKGTRFDLQSGTRGPRGTLIPDETLSRSEQRVVDALAWLEMIGLSPARQVAIACLAGYRVRSAGWVGVRRKLRRRGLILHVRGATQLALTPEGRKRASALEQPSNLAELHAAVLARLDVLEGRILQALLQAHPLTLDDATLARRCSHARDDIFRASRGRLQELGLIRFPEPGRMCASDVLLRHGATLQQSDPEGPRSAAEAAEGAPIVRRPRLLSLVSGGLRFSPTADPSEASS